MTVKEFCQILNLDDCGVHSITIRAVNGNKITEEHYSDSDFGYGEDYDCYTTVTERLIGEYGDWQIMDDNYITSDGCFVVDLRKAG
ncbi:MAG: hypothetical protein KBS60_01285 [Phascolarctobacterium sp.]|nr:hypothetical protein [Candidatus Phascolarctobacterium caballi]